MALYQKRQETVSAVQWYPPGHANCNPAITVLDGDEHAARIDGRVYSGRVGFATVYDLEATHCRWPLSAGDWIIAHADGAISACCDKEFAEHYQPLAQ